MKSPRVSTTSPQERPLYGRGYVSAVVNLFVYLAVWSVQENSEQTLLRNLPYLKLERVKKRCFIMRLYDLRTILGERKMRWVKRRYIHMAYETQSWYSGSGRADIL